MRVIVYKIDLRLNNQDEYPVPVTTMLPYPDDDPDVIDYVKSVAIDGEYTFEEWDEPEPETQKTVWDELDAAYQAGYEEGYTEGVNSAYDE